jgi:hypothetical protein
MLKESPGQRANAYKVMGIDSDASHAFSNPSVPEYLQ